MNGESNPVWPDDPFCANCGKSWKELELVWWEDKRWLCHPCLYLLGLETRPKPVVVKAEPYDMSKNYASRRAKYAALTMLAFFATLALLFILNP